MPKRQNTSAAESAVQVRFEADGKRVAADVGMSVLEVAEKGGQPIEAGCRMGVRGGSHSHPRWHVVPVDRGRGRTEYVAAVGSRQVHADGLLRADQERLCQRFADSRARRRRRCQADSPRPLDRQCGGVGQGIAGVTAVDFIRRGHPDCEIHIVARESHALYNRMGISRLVYGRSARQGLYLLPEQWLNTVATRIDLRWRRVQLGIGDALPFDRLILAMGSSAAAPPIGGLDRPGSFALRETGDAMHGRPTARLPSSRRCGRRAARLGGRLLAAPARLEGDGARTRQPAVESPD